MSVPFRICASAVFILFLSSVTRSSELPSPVRDPVIPNLPRLAQKSGYIFSGTVKSVGRIAPTAVNRVPVVRITFHVETGYVGVHSGQDLLVTEYAGLWQSGETYHPGEKLLLFLYPPSKLGLTSAVGGVSGRFSVGPGGNIIIDPGRMPLRPVRAPLRGPIQGSHNPSGIQLKPQEFGRALRSALEERP